MKKKTMKKKDQIQMKNYRLNEQEQTLTLESRNQIERER